MKVSTMIEKLKDYNQDADIFIQRPDYDEPNNPQWYLDSVDYILSDASKEYKDVDKIVLCPLSEEDMLKWDTLVEQNTNEMKKTTVLKIANNNNLEEDIKNLQPPIPVEYFPNNMGINLCSVESEIWTRKEDGQLENITINFIPEEN